MTDDGDERPFGDGGVETTPGDGEGATGGVASAGRGRLAAARALALRVCVGDRLGLVVFLGTLAFVASYWRVGVFINDNYTLANALVSLADGHLWVGDAVFGPGLETPGMNAFEGRYYGRNYGQLAFALPFLWALQALGAVVDPGLVFPACWSLLAVALGREAGGVFDRRSLGASVGAGVGLAAFGVNVAVARPLSPDLFPVAALQVSSMVAAGLAATTLYRLVARMHGRAVGVAAAALTALATPIGFWASMPKRHVLTVALVLGTGYALYRSREDRSTAALVSPLGFRATAYALVGLLTWVHGGEAFAVFLALVVVDVPTARSNDVRSLAVVGVVFSLSMVPFLATNALVSGDPLRPPRMLRSFGRVTDTLGGGSGGGSAGGGSAGGASAGGGSAGLLVTVLRLLPPPVAGAVSLAFDRLDILFGQFVRGSRVLVADPGRLVSVFIRGGDIQGVSERNFHRTIYLTVTEASPVVAGAVAVGAVGVARGWGPVRESLDAGSIPARTRIRSGLVGSNPSPAASTDAFFLAVGVAFLLLYVSILPVHAQLTVRYLLPVYPLAVYAMARLPSLRRALAGHWRAGLWTWALGVFVGGQAFVAVVAVRSLSGGEAVQVHALVGLAVATAFAALAVATVFSERFDRATAVAGGLAAALGTDFLLLSGLAYFQYGQYALPAAGWVADLLATA